jgi:ribosomal protein L29
MKAVELRAKPSLDLSTILRERLLRREELVQATVQRHVKNVKELRAVRKDIARLHTLLHERGL